MNISPKVLQDALDSHQGYLPKLLASQDLVDNRVLIIQRIFPDYRKEVFDQLQRSVDFKLIYSRNRLSVEQVEAPYSTKIFAMHFFKKETNVFLNVLPSLLKLRPKLIIHEFSMGIVSLIPTLILARILGIKFLLWGHGYNRVKGFRPDKSIMDKIRLYLLQRADAVILYAQEGKRRLSRYISPSKMFVASNALNTHDLIHIRSMLEQEGKDKLKERLGFSSDINLIYIGRLLDYKKPKMLLELLPKLEKRLKKSVTVRFVGDGPEFAKLEQIVRERDLYEKVIFYGAVSDRWISGELLFASDLMIIPGLAGLSINHALNFDCPVLTCQCNGHGPEIEYLIDGETGFILSECNLEAFVDAIEEYFSDQKNAQMMKTSIRKMIDQQCSIENFVCGFEAALKYASNGRILTFNVD